MHAASSATTAVFEDHGRRNTILAMLGVAAGLAIMAVGLSLGISPLGGLWPGGSTEQGTLAPLVVPTSGPEPEVAPSPAGAVAIRGAEGPERALGAGARVPDVPPDDPTTPPAGAVETIFTAAGDAADALLEPVIDVSALRDWLLPSTTDDAGLLPPLDLALV